MEGAPVPMDLNRLKNILGNAKKVMAATEEKFDKKGPKKAIRETEEEYYETPRSRQPAAPIYDERDEREPAYEMPNISQGGQTFEQRDYTAEDVMRSKLPQVVKEAMLKNPIPRLAAPPSKFSLEDLSDLVDKPRQIARQPLRETAQRSGDVITISESELNNLIDKRVNQVLAQMFTKTISEQAIKKTISTLISEGKIAVKKKV